jgi:hypothetical protein
MSIDLDAVERELIEEGVMDQLLERPGKQYTDVQEMVADLRVEQRRGFEDADKGNDHGDDDDDGDHETPSFQPPSVPLGEQRSRTTVHGKGAQTGPKVVTAAGCFDHHDDKYLYRV